MGKDLNLELLKSKLLSAEAQIELLNCKHEIVSKLFIDNHNGLVDKMVALQKENERLNKILKQEFNENDELGAEYLGITMVRDENARLREALESTRDALQELKDRADEEIRCLEFYKFGRDPVVKQLTPHGEGQLSAWETVRRLLAKIQTALAKDGE